MKKLVDGRLVEFDGIKGTPTERRMKARGLGDVVARMAQPVARVIDAVAGTSVAQCGGCKKRQEALNKAVPFG